MDEHRALMIELGSMAEEQEVGMKCRGEDWDEDARLFVTIGMEWDDQSSTMYGQLITDELLAHEMSYGNADLWWKFEMIWMKKESRATNEALKVPEGSSENKESIMNEDFRKIVDEIMKEELIMKATDRWHEEGLAGLFSDEILWYEEATDYPPSVMDDVRGWRPATPIVWGPDACDEEAMDFELSKMDEMSGLQLTSPFVKKQKLSL